jgi:DNA-binding MarR family transcriptional regulator
MRFTAIANSIVPHHVPFPLVRRLQQICLTMSASITEEEELTPQQYTVIACLDDFPGIDQRRLGEITGIDRTIVGQLIDQLEKQGLIDRQVNGADRRARVLRLTPAGEIMRRRIRPKLVAAQARLLAPLTPAEQDTLIDLLIRVVKANEEFARPGAGRRRSRKHATGSVEGGTNDQNRPATVPRHRGDPLSRQSRTNRTG